jgi:hypothetical protein
MLETILLPLDPMRRRRRILIAVPSLSLATAMASLSASRARPGGQPTGTPALSLLLEHLKIKYLDVLYCW